MTTVFDKHFRQSGFPTLLSQFGECVTYLPNGGTARKIKAIIEREPPAIFDAAGNAVLPSAIIRVRNCRKNGVAAKDLDVGKDQFEFVLKIGQTTPKRFSVMRLISQDAGVTHLAVT